jgi:hypothetical protein
MDGIGPLHTFTYRVRLGTSPQGELVLGISMGAWPGYEALYIVDFLEAAPIESEPWLWFDLHCPYKPIDIRRMASGHLSKYLPTPQYGIKDLVVEHVLRVLEERPCGTSPEENFIVVAGLLQEEGCRWEEWNS